MNKRTRGTIGENLAVDYLRENGYRVLERNYRYDRAEVDIIAEDNEVLVFVEVKARRSKTYGEPEEAVTLRKQMQLRKAAEGFLLERNIEDRECRFDIVAIHWETNEHRVHHIVDAF